MLQDFSFVNKGKIWLISSDCSDQFQEISNCMVSKFFICSMQEKSKGPLEYFSSKIQIICEAFSKVNHWSYWEVFGLMEILKILIQFGREFGTTNWPIEKLLHIVTFLKLSQSLKSSFLMSFTCKNYINKKLLENTGTLITLTCKILKHKSYQFISK